MKKFLLIQLPAVILVATGIFMLIGPGDALLLGLAMINSVQSIGGIS